MVRKGANSFLKGNTANPTIKSKFNLKGNTADHIKAFKETLAKDSADLTQEREERQIHRRLYKFALKEWFAHGYSKQELYDKEGYVSKDNTAEGKL